ncbi:MAG: hypothetical protein COY02_04030 [Parcubacteria group bacterium CG_4_10_14_0_2_um_filter_41_6]|nr:MAG: hypothetical protein COY02_04030 [Parcubacteria group bacterium CG_4_10_14_0_2_um_filter_41_6]
MLKMKCPLCQIINQTYRVIKKNKTAFCAVNLEALNSGHVMVLPKRHVADLAKLTAQEAKDLLDLTSAMFKKINKIFKHDAILFMNTKSHSSQKHVHFHILPSRAGLREFMAKYDGVPFKQKKSKQELTCIKEKLCGK